MEPHEHPPLPPAVPPVTRRDFLFKLGLGLNAIAAAFVGIPIVGYIASALFRPKAQQAWIALGKIAQFPPGETRLASYRNPFTTPWDGATADIPCWVRRKPDGDFQVFAINCAHLGCPVRWFPQSGLFMCPCHGGVYYEDGSRASGPPPRGLFEYAYRVRRNRLEVRGGQTPNLSEPV
ncbi:MAG TPA: Rieske (2Fe-2S) protein [Myxococcales bacterium]|nr:Rieske (2Fe-2S) protein [Myxococcales bacterium]